MSLNWRGHAALLGFLTRLASNVSESFGAAMHAQGLKVMAKAKKMTPVDTGRLRASGFVGAPQLKGRKTVIKIGFGTDYALAVHEAPGVLKGEPRENGRGKYWDPQGSAQPKFLEKAIDQSGDLEAEAESILEEFLDSGVAIKPTGGGTTFGD